jgi:hypothetical protein
LPESGEETVTFPSASTDYVTEPPVDSEYLPDGVVCSQSYSYRLKDAADTTHNPTTLEIDSETGVFTFTNIYDIKTSYEIEIDIPTTDGTNNYHLTVTGITLNIVCGQLSTILTPPILPTLYQVPNIL